MRGGKRKGAGRPLKKEIRESVTIRLPEKLITKLDKIQGTRTENIEKAINDYLRTNHNE